MDLDRAISISASGLAAQSARLRVVAENIANRDSTGESPGADPYRRRIVTFASRMDRTMGERVPVARSPGEDPSPFQQRFEPGHPAANTDGYVKISNVNSLIEMMDMREAQRSFSGNLAVIETTRGMLVRTLELLR
jgi:flagellar basal-body rod protein FlgC